MEWQHAEQRLTFHGRSSSWAFGQLSWKGRAKNPTGLRMQCLCWATTPVWCKPAIFESVQTHSPQRKTMPEWTTAGWSQSPKSPSLSGLCWAGNIGASPSTLPCQITFDYLQQIPLLPASHSHTSLLNGAALVGCHPSIKSWMMWQLPLCVSLHLQLPVSEDAPCQVMPQWSPKPGRTCRHQERPQY